MYYRYQVKYQQHSYSSALVMRDVSLMTYVELLVLEALLEVVLLALEAHDERV